MKLVGIKEAAQGLGISVHELRSGARKGKYPHHKAGNKYLFDAELLEEAVRKMMSEGTKGQVEQHV